MASSDLVEKEDLRNIVEEKRKEMILIGMEKGLGHIETIQCSHELDKLLNEYREYLI